MEAVPTLVLLAATFHSVACLQELAYGQEGKTVILTPYKETDDLDPDHVFWYAGEEPLFRYYPPSEKLQRMASEDRVEFDPNTFSLRLKHPQKNDSRRYRVEMGLPDKTLVKEFNLTVLEPAKQPVLAIMCKEFSGDPYNVTVTCGSGNLSQTVSCNRNGCEGGGEDTLDPTLKIYLDDGRIICNNSNQVSWSSASRDIHTPCSAEKGNTTAGTMAAVVAVAGIMAAVVAVCWKRRQDILDGIRKCVSVKNINASKTATLRDLSASTPVDHSDRSPPSPPNSPSLPLVPQSPTPTKGPTSTSPTDPRRSPPGRHSRGHSPPGGHSPTGRHSPSRGLSPPGGHSPTGRRSPPEGHSPTGRCSPTGRRSPSGGHSPSGRCSPPREDSPFPSRGYSSPGKGSPLEGCFPSHTLASTPVQDDHLDTPSCAKPGAPLSMGKKTPFERVPKSDALKLARRMLFVEK